MSRKWQMCLTMFVVVSLALTAAGFAAPALAEEPFDWRQAEGTKINLLLNKHGYVDSMLAYLDEFEELTGIEVEYSIVPEEEYFEKVTMDLMSGAGAFDAFMVGAYHTWTYAPGGGMEPLEDYITNPSLTNPDYDWEDVFPSLRKSLQWNGELGTGLGEGHQWAIPWGFEVNALMYRGDVLEDMDITVPATWPELAAAAAALQEEFGEEGVYGIAQRGSLSWATIHPGYLTGFATFGGRDFDENMKCSINSPEGVEFTDMWVKMVKDSGPPGWTVQTWMENVADIKAGLSYLYVDADIAGPFMATPGVPELWDQDKDESLIYLAPPPAGPDETFVTNTWIWSLAMNAASKNKVGAWLWMQWATGKDFLKKATVEHWLDNPIRQSVVDNPAYQEKMAKYPHYLETLAQTVPNAGIYFSPEPEYAYVGDRWAAALHEIYEGRKDTQTALDDLCAEIDAHMEEVGLVE
jgi:multiple sugar transport system substrate-binding protein